MIPLKLELTNFLSYRKTAVIDFQGIHLACISGLNGAGKSSILDGITWALFGQSRSRSDDDVVNRLAALNGEAGQVQFDFELEGSTYRVIRRKQVGRSMVLEFQVAAGSTDNGHIRWKTLSEGRLRETQAAIEHLLSMNFDVFINASFLLQGKADEFTTKTANRRKEILAELLSVNRWDVYRHAAANHRKEEEGELLLVDGRIADIDQELAEEPEREAALAAAQSELKVITSQRELQDRLLEQLRRAETVIKQQKQLVKNLADNLSRSQRGLEKLKQNRAQRQRERDGYQSLLDQAEQIAADFAAWQGAEAVLEGWQQKADAYHAIQQQKRPHELTLERERSRLTQRQAELEGQAGRVAAMSQEHEKVTQSLRQGQEQLRQLLAKAAALAEQESAWRQARETLQKIEHERKLLSQELNQLQAQARRVDNLQQERLAVEKNLQEATAAWDRLAAEVAALARKRQGHAIALADLDSRKAEQPRLKEEMNKIKERLERLQAETGGSCPLCGQALSETHRQAVLAELQSEGKQKGERFRDNQAQIQALTAEVTGLAKQLQQSERLERDQQAQQQRQAAAQARLEQIDQAMAEWQAEGAGRLAQLTTALADDSVLQRQRQRVADLSTAAQDKAVLDKEQQEQQREISMAEARLAQIERVTAEWDREGKAALVTVKQQFAENQIAPEAQAALAELEFQVAELAYDPAANESARQARNSLSDAPARYRELGQAEAAVKPLDDTLQDLNRQVDEQEKDLVELCHQHEEAVAQLETMSADGGDLVRVEQEVFRLREQEIAANRRVGAAQQRLAVLADLRNQRDQLTNERAALTLLIQRLKLLEKACGRDGVQALLIERTLPEIEDDANELLERLTGGQMRVFFDTQRKLKSVDRMAETLDIRIVDGAGERPYENFSGGEQFRVNFAIRLALSRILARRAGARLQTLVIDEGFGSQDPEGRQRLVEAIHTIQDDFARILVITHIDELRDAFPNRIEVEKVTAGSTVSVI